MSKIEQTFDSKFKFPSSLTARDIELIKKQCHWPKKLLQVGLVLSIKLKIQMIVFMMTLKFTFQRFQLSKTLEWPGKTF